MWFLLSNIKLAAHCPCTRFWKVAWKIPFQRAHKPSAFVRWPVWSACIRWLVWKPNQHAGALNRWRAVDLCVFPVERLATTLRILEQSCTWRLATSDATLTYLRIWKQSFHVNWQLDTTLYYQIRNVPGDWRQATGFNLRMWEQSCPGDWQLDTTLEY